jgi:hypothetical protein
VRFLAIILVTLMLPLGFNVSSAMACSTTACCGADCSERAPVNQASCCQVPAAPDRASNKALPAQHFDSVASIPTGALIVTISHLRSTTINRGYSPPDRLSSLALLCSRQI